MAGIFDLECYIISAFNGFGTYNIILDIEMINFDSFKPDTDIYRAILSMFDCIGDQIIGDPLEIQALAPQLLGEEALGGDAEVVALVFGVARVRALERLDELDAVELALGLVDVHEVPGVELDAQVVEHVREVLQLDEGDLLDLGEVEFVVVERLHDGRDRVLQVEDHAHHLAVLLRVQFVALLQPHVDHALDDDDHHEVDRRDHLRDVRVVLDHFQEDDQQLALQVHEQERPLLREEQV